VGTSRGLQCSCERRYLQLLAYVIRFQLINPGNPAASYINRQPRIYDLASKRSFQIAKEWLTNCGNLHDNCPQLKPVPLPTRVIDVGTSTSNQQKLITTNGISGYYAALSYCWGAEPQPLVTTQSNIQTLYVDVPTPSLAKTIQEAIFVTRQLGLRYIWIDALCIIQDSPADQDAEIKRMGEIYETATVTIVAASATHCKQGFLQRRSYPWGVQEWRSFKLPFLCPNGKLGELILEPTDPYFTGDQPINHRGWTMQEFILPSRKLVYSTTQLIWQCRSVQAELGNKARRVDSIRKDLIKVQMLPMLLSSNASLSPPTQQPTLETLHNVRFNWQILVQNYTSRSLTKREDVLPGISGIASRFACFLSEEYKAGLWYSESNKLNFIENLFWSVQKRIGLSSSDSVQSNVYTAPSWSWAGQPDQISWQALPDLLAQEDMVCSIEECSVQLAGTAAFGRVKSGILKVRALTRKLGSIGNGDLDDLQCMVSLLEEENISVFLDAPTKNLAARFAPGPLWCILLTVYGGLLIMPLDGKWVRIGIFYEKSAMPTGHTFGGWIQNLEFEELTIV